MSQAHPLPTSLTFDGGCSPRSSRKHRNYPHPRSLEISHSRMMYLIQSSRLLPTSVGKLKMMVWLPFQPSNLLLRMPLLISWSADVGQQSAALTASAKHRIWTVLKCAHAVLMTKNVRTIANCAIWELKKKRKMMTPCFKRYQNDWSDVINNYSVTTLN